MRRDHPRAGQWRRLEAPLDVRDVRPALRVVRNDEVLVGADPRDVDGERLRRLQPRVELISRELDRRYPVVATGSVEIAERGAELVREHAEARPLDSRREREEAACDAQVPRDELGRRRRRLENEPAAVARLRERPDTLRVVDLAEPRPAVTAPCARVLEMHATHEVAESSRLRCGVEPADHRVRQVEVAPEGRRGDALGERKNAVCRERPLVAERHALGGRRRAQGRETVRTSVDVRLAEELGPEEERHEHDVCTQLARPRNRGSHVVGSPPRGARVGVGDAAVLVVEAKHERRDFDPGRGPRPPKALEAPGLEVAPAEHDLHAREPELPCTLEDRGIVVAVTTEDRIDDTRAHESPILSTIPSFGCRPVPTALGGDAHSPASVMASGCCWPRVYEPVPRRGLLPWGERKLA